MQCHPIFLDWFYLRVALDHAFSELTVGGSRVEMLDLHRCTLLRRRNVIHAHAHETWQQQQKHHICRESVIKMAQYSWNTGKNNKIVKSDGTEDQEGYLRESLTSLTGVFAEESGKNESEERSDVHLLFDFRQVNTEFVTEWTDPVVDVTNHLVWKRVTTLQVGCIFTKSQVFWGCANLREYLVEGLQDELDETALCVLICCFLRELSTGFLNYLPLLLTFSEIGVFVEM